MEYKVRHAWGVTNKEPLTSVFQNNNCEFLCEDMMKGIDLDFENHCKECKEEYHDSCWQHQPDDTWLIGFKLNKEIDKFEPDPNAEYSAIINEIYTQVVRSKWGVKGRECSPCYPCQVDPNNEGNWVGYSLPPDVIGESDPEVKKKIFKFE